ncbi:MAG TPA: hypothetical protein PKE00_01700, partial [Planctomycetota bacterium]|nr:hypothetical protein [Planctomycetota bacterium]
IGQSFDMPAIAVATSFWLAASSFWKAWTTEFCVVAQQVVAVALSWQVALSCDALQVAASCCWAFE